MVPSKDHQKVFVMLVLVVLSSLEFFRFRTFFLCHRHSTLTSQAYEDLCYLWVLLWLLSVAYFCQVLPLLVCLILPEALRFWLGKFYPQAFVTLKFLPHFGTYITQMQAGTLHPGSFFMLALIHSIQGLSLCLLSCAWFELLMLEWKDGWFADWDSEPRSIE